MFLCVLDKTRFALASLPLKREAHLRAVGPIGAKPILNTNGSQPETEAVASTHEPGANATHITVVRIMCACVCVCKLVPYRMCKNDETYLTSF